MQRIIFTVLLSSFLIFSVFGQEKEVITDSNIVGIEIGTLFVFNIDRQDFGPAQYFGVNLTVAKNMQTGFVSIRGDNINSLSYNMFITTFFFNQNLGLSLCVGADGVFNLSAGMNIFANILKRRFNDQLSTVLKIRIGYIYTETSNQTGSIIVGFTGQIGL